MFGTAAELLKYRGGLAARMAGTSPAMTGKRAPCRNWFGAVEIRYGA